MTTPRRRGFRLNFSLRTQFVVVAVLAVVSSWVVYQLNWLRERQAALAGDRIVRLMRPSPDTVNWEPTPQPPWSLRLFGAQPLECTSLGVQWATKEDEVRRLQLLFPEVNVERYGN